VKELAERWEQWSRVVLPPRCRMSYLLAFRLSYRSSRISHNRSGAIEIISLKMKIQFSFFDSLYTRKKQVVSYSTILFIELLVT